MPATKTIRDLKPAPYNPRTIRKDELEALGKSLREFGDLSGIVVNGATGNIVGGHQRMKHLDPAWEIKASAHQDSTGTVAAGHIETPWGRMVYREVWWGAAKEKAANLAANKHGGHFDIPAVKEILAELDDGAFDMDLTGFLLDERLELFGEEDTLKDPDDAPSPGAGSGTRTKLGDIWDLDGHRLYVGDSTKAASWRMLMKGEVADMVFTDPPYGVSYESASGKFDVIAGDTKTGDDLLALLVPAFKALVEHVRQDAGFYIWHPSATREDFAAAMKAAGLVERQYIIWAKPVPVLGHADYQWAHEPAFYASRQGQRPAFYGDRAQPTVWRASIARKAAVSTVIGPGLTIRDGRGGGIVYRVAAPQNEEAAHREGRGRPDRPHRRRRQGRHRLGSRPGHWIQASDPEAGRARAPRAGELEQARRDRPRRLSGIRDHAPWRGDLRPPMLWHGTRPEVC